MILAGDIGGTNARIALFDRDDIRTPVRVEVVRSAESASLESIIELFLDVEPVVIEAATLGVAGPVRDGRAELTNVGWGVDEASVARTLELETAGVINDLEATAWGLASLGPEELVALNDVPPQTGGNVAVIAAGTGLGEAGLVRTQGTSIPFATESGHASFAPATAEQSRLLEFLRDEARPHVSVEAVCSGTGLVNIYRWCLAEEAESEPPWLIEELQQGDAAAAIAGAAEAGTDSAAERALRVFVEIYGSEAGNLALRLLATGGVYVAGGIAVKLVDQLVSGRFMAAFVAKHPLSDLLQSIPVHVVMNDLTALLGAARHAASVRDGFRT